MEIKVIALREALEIVKPVVPKKPTLAVLTSVHLGGGRVEATDLETAIAVDIDGADEQCLMPCHSVLELLKRIPGNELLSIEQKSGTLNLTWPGGSASYDVAKPTEFPGFPKLKVKSQKAVDGGALVPALSSLVGYCATDEARPVLTGIILFLGESLEISAGDGFRLAYKVLPMNFIIEGMHNAIVPAQAIRHLAYAWEKSPRSAPTGNTIVQLVTSKRMIDLTFQKDKMAASFDGVTMVITLVQGEPPAMTQLIPKETPPMVRFFAPDFERAVRSVLGPAKGDKGIVRCSWEEKLMTISAKSEEKGNVETSIPVEAEQPGKVALKASNLIDYIKGREGLVSMGVQSEKQPVLFRHSTTPIVLLMPMFVDW